MKVYDGSKDVLFAFNIWDFESAMAVMEAAKETTGKVILQTSMSTYKKLPHKEFRSFVTQFSDNQGIRAWLHLDHCTDVQMLKNAVDCGWDSVMLDYSDRNLKENIEVVKQITEYVQGSDCLIEAEIGRVQGVEDNVGSREGNIATEHAIDTFMEQTNVDLIAVAFGNAHGIYEGTPDLHYNLVEYTTERYGKPFVVHGGSGLSDDVLIKLMTIQNVKKINISTDLKLAYRQGILEAKEKDLIREKGFQTTAVEECIFRSVKETAKAKLMLTENL
ncbi:MAG: class II fructose-bisphosphate aldolase [Lachnospiraceae bacterium]|nr:class II fructose-bisphosphate aldolase [Lachnospiraceae bacterium]